MPQHYIFFPVLSLVVLTFGIAIWMAKLRFVAVRRGDIDGRFFKLNRGGEPPEYLVKVSQNYDNLLEIPILFYALCGFLYMTGQVEPAQLILAWVFVISRYVHSYVHTVRNKLMLRLQVFIFGFTVLGAMWCLFLARLIRM